MAKVQACFRTILLDPGEKTYLFFCAGIGASKGNIAKRNQGFQHIRL
jgi:hypothetical protein